MQAPAALIKTQLNVTSSATPNTLTTAQILAGPGVGIRYRLWLFFASPTTTSQAIANWRIALGNFPVTVLHGNLSGPNFVSPPPIAWPGGLALPANDALGYQLQSALASGAFTLWVFYTIEAA